MEPRSSGGGAGSRIARPVAVALALAGAGTGLAAIPGISTAGAAVIYVLVVTGASAMGGLRAGLAASALSFLALNFFFTPPLHRLTVAKPEDLVALVVFLVVSVVVGTLLSSAVAQRARAERREREAFLLHRLGTRLLSGEPVADVLESFAEAVTELLPLARCEIRTELTAEPIVSERRGAEPGEPESIPMVAMGREVGQIVLSSALPGTEISEQERNVVQAFAGQMGLALEGVRQSSEAAGARLEAEASRLRAALFSSVTHDLRTPLASITAAVTSLLDGDPGFSDEQRTELLETIRHEAERMNRLVGNLVDLARIRAGALVPSKTPAAIDEIIEGVVARLQPLLKDHEVMLRLREDLPEVPVDVVQIDQVLTNLLENAARFSSPGSPIVVSAARWQHTVEVQVADRGEGIPPEELAHVFELFWSGDESSGTGMGLAIGRAIVEAHGGKIWIQDTPGGGTTVVFQLPVT